MIVIIVLPVLVTTLREQDELLNDGGKNLEVRFSCR